MQKIDYCQKIENIAFYQVMRRLSQSKFHRNIMLMMIGDSIVNAYTHYGPKS